MVVAYLFPLPPFHTSQPAWYEFVTHAFVHANVVHLLLNSIVLLQFGLLTERIIGTRNFLLVLLASILGGAWFHWCSGEHGDLVGMSGGVFGIMACYAHLRPDQGVWLLFFRMKMLTAMIVLTAVSLALAWSHALPGIGHWAHLGGIFVGWICGWRLHVRSKD